MSAFRVAYAVLLATAISVPRAVGGDPTDSETDSSGVLAEPHFIHIRYARASSIRMILNQLSASPRRKDPSELATRGGRQETGLGGTASVPTTVKIAADDRMNVLIVLAPPQDVGVVERIVKVLDVPVDAREEPHVIQIRHAKASGIKKVLEQIIVPSANMGPQKPPTLVPSRPGVVRRDPAPVQKPRGIAELVQHATKSLVRGNVRIAADDRANILIIVTRPENMTFFEKVVRLLDVEVQAEEGSPQKVQP